MSYDYNDILRDMAEAQFAANNPLRDFTEAQRKKKSSPFHWGTAAPEVEPPVPSKDGWLRATIYGFIGHISARGWKLKRQSVGGAFVYTWQSSRGQQLQCTIHGAEPTQLFAHACGLLAGWEPDLMYWQAAFKEVGVPTSSRGYR